METNGGGVGMEAHAQEIWQGGFKFQVQRVNDGAGARRLPGAWRN